MFELLPASLAAVVRWFLSLTRIASVRPPGPGGPAAWPGTVAALWHFVPWAPEAQQHHFLPLVSTSWEPSGPRGPLTWPLPLLTVVTKPLMVALWPKEGLGPTHGQAMERHHHFSLGAGGTEARSQCPEERCHGTDLALLTYSCVRGGLGR